MLAGTAQSFMHCAGVRTPAKQLVSPKSVYPVWHVGLHVAPDARVDVHVPADALCAGKTEEASHAFGSHMGAVRLPMLQLKTPFSVCLLYTSPSPRDS